MDGLISKNGIVLQEVRDGYLFVDGTALYVDNLIDCFKTWNGKGSLRKYCEKQYRKELALMAALPDTPDPLLEGQRKMWQDLTNLISGEDEGTLLEAYLSWRDHPKTTIERLIASLRRGEQTNQVNFQQGR